MKKKGLIICTSLIIVTLIIFIGYRMHINKKEHYIQTQEKRIDLYFKHNLKDYHSMHVTSFKKSPMNGYFVHGYINSNKKYKFQILISAADHSQFTGDVGGYDDKTLGKFFISDNPKKILTPDEIIKKEHLDKDKYEADPPAFFFF
ncbi:DUF1433 domain-containing protein [Staphylococcus warneri]|uniref:DUF1433 domain-containing protein n=1 Tax=Staphylococcus warneri TaxID=1292 RepID=UPI0032601FF8